MELPIAFTQSTRTLLGDESYAAFAAALESEQPTSIRINEAKLPVMNAAGYTPVPWATRGYWLDNRPAFTFDPLFHAGCYYVQEASSMFVEQALKQYLPGQPVVMLDLCAAPGGKSTLARSVLPAGSLLVANEVMRNRSQILAENLTKWGNPDVVVTNNDPADFTPLTHLFDVILTDVPCSGEGMFRKDPVAVSEWSLDNVELCWQRQRRILADVWQALKPGGILLYSTCTYNTKENEENVKWICTELGAEVLPVAVDEAWNITGNLLSGEEFPVYRFLPHKTVGEGFFLAVLRKAAGEISVCVTAESRKPRTKAKGKNAVKPMPQTKTVIEQFQLWDLAAAHHNITLSETTAVAFPKQYQEVLELLSAHLRILQAGITLAELKGKDWIPSHSLAMSTTLNKEAFQQVEVSYEQAVAYLRKEAVTLSADTPRGIVLLTYKNIPLGFVKNIGNRANNLYPQEWRIRSGYNHSLCQSGVLSF